MLGSYIQEYIKKRGNFKVLKSQDPEYRSQSLVYQKSQDQLVPFSSKKKGAEDGSESHQNLVQSIFQRSDIYKNA